MEPTVPGAHSRPTALKTDGFQRINLIGEEHMKSPVITENRVSTLHPAAPEPAKKKVAAQNASSPAHHDKLLQGAQLQQGRSSAARLRQALEQNAPAVERKPSPAAGVVIKYPADSKLMRRQRSESDEKEMALDEKIHHLNGSRRNLEQERKQVLAQRRQANSGFKKNVAVKQLETVDDRASEDWDWGEDH